MLAVTQVATLLGEHHQWWGLGRAFIVLALVYRTWVTTSLQTNRLSRDSTRDRITLFGVGFCGLVMAIAIPHVYDSGGMQFALAYWAARILLWLRYVPQYRPRVVTSLGLSATVIGPMLVVGALLPDTWREVVWLVAALCDLGSVAVMGRMHRFIHYDHSHLMERFGLFVLIALGEQIVDLSLPLARQPDNIRPLELLARRGVFRRRLHAVVDLLRPLERGHHVGDRGQPGARGHVPAAHHTGTSASSAGSSASPWGSSRW